MTASPDALTFVQMVWQVVASIPKGKVATYGQVAALAGFKNYARQVGRALHNLPEGTALPWHRVVNAQGRLSFPLDSEAYRTQKVRLESEGVYFRAGGIALREYGWKLTP